MRFKLAAGCAAVIVATAVPASAFAPGVNLARSDTTIAITGVVPVICRAQVDAGSVVGTPGTVSLGQLREFCNSPHGYRVYADYSPSLAHAKLLVDGVPVPLQKDGSTLVSHSPKAAIDSRVLALELPKKGNTPVSGSLSFRIEPQL
jgi:hypothetical protein